MFEVNETFQTPYQFTKGFIGGVNAMLFAYPMNSLKIHMQQQLLNRHDTYTARISVRGLYAGIIPFAITIGATLGTQNVAEQYMKESAYMQNSIMSAGFGGILSTAVNCPAEYVITKMRSLQIPTMSEALRNCLGAMPARAFYNALLSTALREGVFSGVCLGGGRVVNARLKSYDFFSQHPFISTVVSSTLVAGPGVWLSHPADTIKTYQQTHDLNVMNAIRGIVSDVKNAKVSLVANTLFRPRKQMPLSQGIAVSRAFFSGVSARFFFVMPAIVTMHTTMNYLDSKCQQNPKRTL